MKNYKNYITELNKYTSYYVNEYDENDLILDDSKIDNYFYDNYDLSEFKTLALTNLSTFLNFVDYERLNRDTFNGFKESINIEYEDNSDISSYLIDNENKYIDKLNKLFQKEVIDNIDKNDFNEEEYNEEVNFYNSFTYNEKIDEIENYNLIDIIDKDDYIKYQWKGRYGEDAITYLEQLYGSFDNDDGDINDDNTKVKFDQIENYIEWDKFEKSILLDFGFDERKSFYIDNLPTDMELQTYLFSYDENNILPLVNMIDQKNDLTVSFEFQNNYIKEYLIHPDTDEDIKDDEYINKSDVIYALLDILEVKYDVCDELIKKYPDETHKIKLKRTKSKYNI